MDAIELEVFRAGSKAARGITADAIAALASGYTGANPIPVCIGHPKSDKPAHGEVASFRADGNSLFATIKNLGAAVVDGVKKGELLNRSMAFFSPTHEANPTPGQLAPRHLAFLGASAPGIPNMPRLDKALAFSTDDDTITVDGPPAEAIVYEAAPTSIRTVTEEPNVNEPKTAEQLAQEAADLETRRTAFEAEVKETRETANAGIVDGLVASGRLLPKDAARAKLIFNAIAPDALEFEAGKPKRSPAAELADLLGTGAKLVPIGPRESPSERFTADPDIPVADQARDITGRARALMEKDKSLSFEAAVEKVSQDQEG